MFIRQGLKNIIFLIAFSLAVHPIAVFADVMTSTNYRIFSDVLSVGGVYSTSTNFGLFDTLGETPVQQTSSSSSNFEIQSGFWGMSSSTVLSVSFSTASVDLGTLVNNTVKSATQIMTVTTNAFNGYTTTVQSDGLLRTSGGNSITAVSDSEVSAGSSESGIKTSGSNGQMNSSDVGLSTSSQTLAQSSAAVIGNQITITYKAAISGSVSAGSYSQTVTFTTTANF